MPAAGQVCILAWPRVSEPSAWVLASPLSVTGDGSPSWALVMNPEYFRGCFYTEPITLLKLLSLRGAVPAHGRGAWDSGWCRWPTGHSCHWAVGAGQVREALPLGSECPHPMGLVELLVGSPQGRLPVGRPVHAVPKH